VRARRCRRPRARPRTPGRQAPSETGSLHSRERSYLLDAPALVPVSVICSKPAYPRIIRPRLCPSSASSAA
jgi:hypothetical protein